MAIHRNGRLVYVNASALELVGAHNVEQLVGRAVLDFVHPEDRPDVVARARQAQAQGGLQPVRERERCVRLDGSVVDIEVVAIPVTSEGQPATLVMLRDVTPETAAEQAEQEMNRRMAVLAEASAQLLASLDKRQLLNRILGLAARLVAADAYAVWRYRAETEQWGIEAVSGLSEEYQRETLGVFSSAPTETAWMVVAGNVESEPALKGNVANYRREGIRALLALPLPIRGQNTGTITFYWKDARSFEERDLTATTALANLAGAAIGVAEAYEAERQAHRAAQDAVRARDDFLAVMSHEIKNPITAIKGTVELMQRARRRGEVDADRLYEAFGYVDTSVRRLVKLLEDVFDLSRVRIGQLDLSLESVKINDLVSQVVEQVAAGVPERTRFVVDAAAPLEVRCDRARLGQVLANLLENALKYSPDASPVHIRCMRQDAGCQISISDSGIGFSSDQANVIFELFGRAENARSRHVPGMGLGLYVSRQIIESHGGRLWAESPGEDRGSTFHLWLPADIDA